MWNMLPGCRLMPGMGGMVRTGRGRERSRAEIAVVRVLEKRLGALPVVAEFGRRLRIAEIVDELCPVRPVAWITHGEVIEALVANRLTAPAPMVRVQDWAAAMAVEEAYGIAPELLNDDRIARALDAIAPQLDAIAGGAGAAAVTEFGVDVSRLHWDLTSISLYGAYPQADLEYPAPRWGHPKDRRPDLKQIQAGLAVSGDGGIPVFHHAYAGGAAEVAQVVGAMTALRQIAGPRPGSRLVYSPRCRRGRARWWTMPPGVTPVSPPRPAEPTGSWKTAGWIWLARVRLTRRCICAGSWCIPQRTPRARETLTGWCAPPGPGFTPRPTPSPPAPWRSPPSAASRRTCAPRSATA